MIFSPQLLFKAVYFFDAQLSSATIKHFLNAWRSYNRYRTILSLRLSIFQNYVQNIPARLSLKHMCLRIDFESVLCVVEIDKLIQMLPAWR